MYTMGLSLRRHIRIILSFNLINLSLAMVHGENRKNTIQKNNLSREGKVSVPMYNLRKAPRYRPRSLPLISVRSKRRLR